MNIKTKRSKSVIKDSSWLWYSGRGIVYCFDGETNVYYSGNVPKSIVKKFNAIKKY